MKCLDFFCELNVRLHVRDLYIPIASTYKSQP